MTFFQYTLYTLFILDGWMDLHHVFDTSMSSGSGAAGGYVEAGSAYASSPPSIPAFCALHGTDLASPVQGGKMRRQ